MASIVKVIKTKDRFFELNDLVSVRTGSGMIGGRITDIDGSEVTLDLSSEFYSSTRVISVDLFSDISEFSSDSHLKGLENKYTVTRKKDNSPVYNCFVLQPEKDEAALLALIEYANATKNEALKDDINEWINEINERMIAKAREETLWGSSLTE